LATVAKVLPVTIATKICSRKPWNYCASIGILMNTRGIVQLVVLNIGVQLKVISPVIFAMFVLMATVLTIFTSPVLYFLYQRNSDPKTLEESKTAHDLHLVLQGENNLEKSAPTSESKINSQRYMSSASIKSNMKIERLASLSVLSDHRLSFPRTISNGENDRSMLNNNVNRRKSSHMTLF
jgi:hypothetical protein